MIYLKCEGCSVEAEFNNHNEAFNAGWDCPPHFFTHITCPDCGIDKTEWWRQMQERNNNHANSK